MREMKTTRQIRHARMEDLPVILELIECGRQKMRESGNMDQWTNGDPATSLFENDIRLGNSYIMEEEGLPIATFAFVPGPDPTYLKIYEGKWLETESPYYVIHRLASKPHVHHILASALQFAFTQTNSLRIDTHRKNTPMRHALLKNGFSYCGIIFLENGAERLAYQKVLTQKIDDTEPV